MNTKTYAERLESLNIETHDDGCILQCYSDTLWFLETNHGTETVSTDVADIPKLESGLCPLDVLAEIDDTHGLDSAPSLLLKVFEDYIEGNDIHSGERKDSWCAYWSMPGCMDQGTHHTDGSEAGAIAQLLDMDGTEDVRDGIPQWELSALERLAELADEGDDTAIQVMRCHIP